ncbi:MAG: GNAT family N-acetyltransferase [Ignavibacteria bacterium]|nr:GNAT family N-acetyltransferase [Ignavibacteria bacterium]
MPKMVLFLYLGLSCHKTKGKQLKLTVSSENGIQVESWAKYVENHLDGTIYLHPAYLQVLEEQSRQKLLRLVCRDENDIIRGIFPLQYTKGMPYNIWGALVSKRLSSLPRTPIVGPLAEDNTVVTELINAAMDIISKDPGRILQIKTYNPDLPRSSLVKFLWKDEYTTEIPVYPQEIKFINSKNHSSIKRAVNKAINNGVEYRLAESEKDLKQWYRLYLDLNKHHTNPPRPYKLFKISWDILRPKGMMQLALAEQKTNGKKKIIAGLVLYYFNKTVTFAYNGSSRKYFNLRPNDLLHWNTIHNAQKEGYKFYNWGNAGENDAGLAAYKKKWGSEKFSTYQYFYPNPTDIKYKEGTDPSEFTGLKKFIWQLLPLRLTTIIGALVYKYL